MDDVALSMRSDLYIQEAIVQLLALKLRAGATVESLSELTSICLQRASYSSADVGINNGLDIHRLGSVLRSWHTEAKFLSQDGRPRPLMLSGRNSLRTLIRQHYPAKLVDRVVRRLREAKLVKRNNTGAWIPIERHARISQPSHEILEHLSEGIARYVETVMNNVATKNSDEVLFERSCKVTRLPISEFTNFREYVAEQAAAFISAIDDWLERRNATAKSRTKTQTAGVYTFAYVDRNR
jgi:hypothetical protein